MIGARVSHARAWISMLVSLVLALALPALALAQAPTQPQPQEGGQQGTGGGGGGLAGTGFDAWQVGLLGVVCLALAFMLVRSARASRAR